MKKIFVSAVLSLCMALLGGCGATGTKETSSTSEDKPLVVQFVQWKRRQNHSQSI